MHQMFVLMYFTNFLELNTWSIGFSCGDNAHHGIMFDSSDGFMGNTKYMGTKNKISQKTNNIDI